ncbi:hypothetical protein CCUG62472_04642 [Mycobacteroides salmoniphilum]|nr:hypothetical protein CCUG62472_04642 [Mycobacteroides salmoniphilum]
MLGHNVVHFNIFHTSRCRDRRANGRATIAANMLQVTAALYERRVS